MSDDFRFATVGSSQTVGDELLEAAHQLFAESFSFAGSFTGKAYAINDLNNDAEFDLFLCQPTRIDEVATKVPREKIVTLELAPPAAFYVKLSKIPEGETIYIFNNNTIQAEQTASYCRENGLEHHQFVYIAYNELNEQEVAARLANAKYIAGNAKMVGADSVLQSQYRQYVRKDAEIIGARRVATIQSVCAVMHWVSLFTYRKLSSEIAGASDYLNRQLKDINKISDDIFKSISTTAATLTDVDNNIKDERETMENTMAIADTLREAVKNIGGIADSIKYISSQTNLLSLNAAIEAARVGEQGRGFGVVAQEVRKLAEESRLATETIRKAVGDVQTIVSQVTPKLSALLNEMLNNQKQIAAVSKAAQQENSAMQEILKSLHSINDISDKLGNSINKLVS